MWSWLLILLQLLPMWFSGQRICLQCKRHRRRRFSPWVGEITCRRAQQLTPVFLPGEPHGQRSLAGYSPWGYRRVGNDWSGVACTILIKLFSHTVFHLPYWVGHFLDLTLILWVLWVYSFHITIHLGGNVLFMHLWICFPLLKIDLKKITLTDI